MADDQEKHVFISYVRDNSKEVERFCDELTKHGVRVWLDRNEIKPGADWHDAIREAIHGGNFFIACFSSEYQSRDKNFMNEEITLAIEELRQFSHDRIWFIPVLLSECHVPARSIGGGKTLLNLNWLPLYENWDVGIQRILEVVRPVPLKIQSLIKALNSGEPNVCRSAAEALGKIGDPASVSALTAALSDGVGWEVRRNAAEALGKIGDPAAVPALTAALSVKEFWQVRLSAAEALGKIGDSAAVPALTATLSHENWEVRRSAAEALGQIGDPAAVLDLTRALTDENPYVRSSVAEALGQIGDPAAVPTLTAALNVREVMQVRQSAVKALGEIDDPAAVAALEKALRDKDYNITRLVAAALKAQRNKGSG